METAVIRPVHSTWRQGLWEFIISNRWWSSSSIKSKMLGARDSKRFKRSQAFEVLAFKLGGNGEKIEQFSAFPVPGRWEVASSAGWGVEGSRGCGGVRWFLEAGKTSGRTESETGQGQTQDLLILAVPFGPLSASGMGPVAEGAP